MFIDYRPAKNKIRTLFFVLFFVFNSNFFSQVKTKLDSVSKLISVQKSDSVKLRLYKTLCVLCLVDENLKYGKLGLDFSERLITNKSKEVSLIKLLEEKLYFLDIISIYYSERREYFEQLQLNKQMIEVAEKINDTFLLEQKYVELAQNIQRAGQAQGAFDTLFSRLKKYENVSQRFRSFYLNNIGEFYYNNYNNGKALYYYQKAFPYYLENKKYEKASKILSRISEQYDLLGQKDQAIKSCLQNLSLIEKLEEKSNKIDILSTLTFLYNAKKDFNASNNAIQQMLLIANKTNNKNALSATFLAMSNFYKNKNDKNKQEECLIKSLEIEEYKQNESNIVFRLSDLSVFYIDDNQYQKSISSAERGLKLAENIKDIDSQKGFWNLLYIGYKKMNKASDALKAFEKFQIMKDSLDNFLNQSSIQTREQGLQFERKQHEMQLEQERKEIISKEEKQKQNIIRNALIIGLILISIVVVFIYKNYRLKKLSNQSLSEQNQIISFQKQEVEQQKHLVEEKHKEITDSINYAERIQRSFLATKELLDENLASPGSAIDSYFVFFKPKDVVSGDFYWASKLSNDNFALVTADSTGHGVPGAIMSLLNITSIESAIKDGFLQPSDILNVTRKTIIERLKKDGSAEGGKDGMDCSLISFDFKNKKLIYAAANNPVWVIRDKEFIALEADRMPIGKHDKDSIPFTQREFDLQLGDVVYTLTDGFPDQFGGPKGKKFMYKQLENLLISISHESMEIQKQKLENVFENWKGDLEQVDDVCVIGVKI